MLYYVYKFFDINLFQYISVRAGFAFFISFCLTMFLIPKYIKWAKAKKANQPINKWVKAHENKQHTPTMGGAVFLFATFIASILTVDMSNIYALTGLFILFGFGAVGMSDDLGKILNNDNLEGLSAKAKMALLILVSIITISILILFAKFPTTFYVPFLKKPLFDMGYFAIIFWTLV